MDDVERWLSYKGTCHVILLAKLHDMYLYKTDNFFHINHYLKSVSKVALLHRFYCNCFREEKSYSIHISEINMTVVTLHPKNASECMLNFSHLHDASWHHIKGALDKYFNTFCICLTSPWEVCQNHLIMVSQIGTIVFVAFLRRGR